MRARRELVAALSVGAVAVVAGVAASMYLVHGPAAVCITPYGVASAASGCNPVHVSATLAALAGALVAVVAAMLASALAALVLRMLPNESAH